MVYSVLQLCRTASYGSPCCCRVRTRDYCAQLMLLLLLLLLLLLQGTDNCALLLKLLLVLQGTDYCAHLLKFMCLGSDAGGINRRPVRVVFTLEEGNKVQSIS